jgi:hypothetical protein
MNPDALVFELVAKIAHGSRSLMGLVKAALGVFRLIFQTAAGGYRGAACPFRGGYLADVITSIRSIALVIAARVLLVPSQGLYPLQFFRKPLHFLRSTRAGPWH